MITIKGSFFNVFQNIQSAVDICKLEAFILFAIDLN